MRIGKSRTPSRRSRRRVPASRSEARLLIERHLFDDLGVSLTPSFRSPPKCSLRSPSARREFSTSSSGVIREETHRHFLPLGNSQFSSRVDVVRNFRYPRERSLANRPSISRGPSVRRISVRWEEPPRVSGRPCERRDRERSTGTPRQRRFQRISWKTTETTVVFYSRPERTRGGHSAFRIRENRKGEDTDRKVNSDTRGSPWRTDARTMLILPDIKLQVIWVYALAIVRR